MAAGICQESRFAVLENSDPEDGSFLPLSNEFRKELVSLLKSLPECSLPLKLFRGKYVEHFGKPFSVREHGYAFLKDLLMTIPETVTVYKTETMIGSKSVHDTFVKLKPSPVIDAAPANASEVRLVPQESKENTYTKEQKERLDAFSRDVAILLKGQPECTMPKSALCREYRAQFGRGLHLSVKEAGCHKLKDFYKLLQTSHIVQFVGSGRNTLIKLSQLGMDIGETAPENSVKEEPKCGTVYEARGRKEITFKDTLWADGRAFFREESKKILECQPEHSILVGQLRDIFRERFGREIFYGFYNRCGYSSLPKLIKSMPQIFQYTYVGLRNRGEAIVRLCAATGPCEDAGEARLKLRQNQIDLFKETDDCKGYLEAAPEEQRRPDMPQTPEIRDGITDGAMSRRKKSWLTQHCQIKSGAPPDNVEVTNPVKADSIQLRDIIGQGRPEKALHPKYDFKHKTRLLMFSVELVEVLKSKPSCFIGISEFVDSFEQHFGKKFSVEDYGYSKLEPVFEALPAVVRIADEMGRIGITLDDSYINEMLKDDILKDDETLKFARECGKVFPTCSELLVSMPDYKINIDHFPEKYFQHFGRLRRPLPDLGFKDLLENFSAMPAKAEDKDNAGAEDDERVKESFERLGLNPIKHYVM